MSTPATTSSTDSVTAAANTAASAPRVNRLRARAWRHPGLWIGGGLVHQGDKFTANDNR